LQNTSGKDFVAKKKGTFVNSSTSSSSIDISNISFRDLLNEAIEKVANLANEIVTKVLKTQILCVGKYCVNEEQFGKILNTSGIDLNSANINQVPVNNSSNSPQNTNSENQVSSTTTASDASINSSWVASSTEPTDLNVSSSTSEIINVASTTDISSAP
jgi:hypothetical protein